MGALFFGLVILAITILAVITFAVSVILLSHAKKQGNKKVLGFFTLALALFLFIIPTVWFLGIRIGNLKATSYCETENIIDGGYQDSHFILNGTNYYVYATGSPKDFPIGEAVASWVDEQSVWDKLWGYCNCGNYYKVYNEQDLDFLSDGSNRLFCSEKDWSAAEQWYGSSSHYQWYIAPIDNKAQANLVEINQEIIDVLVSSEESYKKNSENILTLELPDDEKNTMGSIILFSQSRDNVVEGRSFIFNYYLGTLYICNFSTTNGSMTTFYLQPLPLEINDYLCERLSEP